MNDEKREYLAFQKKNLLKQDSIKKTWLIDKLKFEANFVLPMAINKGFESISNGPEGPLEANTTYTSMNAEFHTNPDMIDDKSVSYILNNDGFRSDNFIREHDGLHILFAGCSETFGSAGKLQDVWAHMCYKDISSKHKTSGYFNIGHPGGSMYTILNQILVYIEKYGKPDVLFLNVPNFERSYSWSFEHNSFIQETDKGAQSNKKKYFDRVFYNAYLYYILEKICRICNIKLIWSCWEQYDAFNIEALDIFENYITLTSFEKFEEYYIKNWDKYKDIEYATIRRDNQHHGSFIHRYWADIFLEEFNKYDI
jgi:hypothetical protein